MNSCPGESLLVALADGTLGPEQSTALERHLEACHRCARRLAELPCWDVLVRGVQRLDAAREQDAALVRRVSDRASALHATRSAQASGTTSQH